MAKPTLKLDQVLQTDAAIFRSPRVIAFNRLEARPRTPDVTRSLRAEVRDPLWMLTRQWQMGELAGEDAASCVTSRIAYQHEKMTRVAFGAAAGFAFDDATMPLETRTERERVPTTVRETAAGAIFSDLLLAAQGGEQLLARLRAAGLDQHYGLYLGRFPLRVLRNPPPVAGTDAPPQDPEGEQIMAALGDRIADGVAVWRAVVDGTHDAWIDATPGADPALKPIAAAFAAAFSARLGRVFNQPETPTDSAWQPNHLEYQLAIAGAPAGQRPQTVLVADQYPGGRLDWYAFDAVDDRTITVGGGGNGDGDGGGAQPPDDQVESFLPSSVRFRGQPQPRFWEMEETETNFGQIETSPTGLLHLLLAEFGLIYSNDWFMLPHPMSIGTVCEIRGIVVDDTFGRHTLIRPAGRGPETLWQRWAMFHQTQRGAARDQSARFFLAPSVSKVLESQPIERINFLRDEMANMVWGVERIVPSQVGQGMSGYETTPTPAPPARGPSSDPDAKIAYVLGTTVPQNWIPFIPVHAEDSVSEIRLQRARMVGGAPPRGRILREPGSPYFVEEEEILRTGIYVDRSWQRARWLGGRTSVWVGRRKTAGRGEGWSQLAFDQIVRSDR